MYELEYETDLDELEAEYEGEFDDAEFDDGELELFDEGTGELDEGEEMELAAEMLTASDDEEMEQFLGKLLGTVARRFGGKALSRLRGRGGRSAPAARGPSRSPRRPGGSLFSKLFQNLRPLFKQALPTTGSTIGGHFGGPKFADIGGQLGDIAGQIFGLELEGLSPEDQEFEVARRLVRLTGTAVKKATRAPITAPASSVAQAAVKAAIRKHAPGLLRGGGLAGRGVGRSGKWIRRGRKIIVLGA